MLTDGVCEGQDRKMDQDERREVEKGNVRETRAWDWTTQRGSPRVDAPNSRMTGVPIIGKLSWTVGN